MADYIGYHGTDAACVNSIKASNFTASTGDDEWLGHGVYFFTQGISCPESNAKEWAINQSWNNTTRSFSYSNYAVLRAKVTTDKSLNTTTLEGLTAFNRLRNSIIKNHDSYFQPTRIIHEDDRVMWNLVAKLMKLDLIIHNLYIKDKIQRRKRISSNVPNVTVMCVKNPNCIDLHSTCLVDKGVTK